MTTFFTKKSFGHIFAEEKIFIPAQK